MALHTYGWIPDTPDHRDFAFPWEPDQVVPPTVDLRPWAPPHMDQGQLGACFVGSTAIPLLNGTTKTLEELSFEESPFWVYAIDPETGNFSPALATSQKTGINKKVIEITLDNGAVSYTHLTLPTIYSV